MGKRPASQPKKSSKAPNRHSPQAPGTVPVAFNLFILFTRRHPFLCLTGTWLVMLMLGWVSIRGLVYTDASPLESEKTQAEVVAAAPQPQVVQPSQAASSFGMLVILALCCAGATLLLARQLRPVKPTSQRRVLNRSMKFQPQHPAPQPAIAVAPPPPSPPQTQPAPPPAPRPAQPISYQVAKPNPKPAKPKVSVVPSEQEHPLDWREAGLANMMDIRKRGSISPL